MREKISYYGKQILKGFAVTGLAALGYLGIRELRTEDGGQSQVNQHQSFGDRVLLSTDEFFSEVNEANSPPIVVHPIANQTIPHNVLFEMPVANTTFFDPDGDSLTLSAVKADGSILPSWLSFNSTVNIFSGFPLIDDYGETEIKVTATDGIASIASTFFIDVQNQAPIIIKPIPDQVVYDNEPFSLTVPYDSFSDPDEDPLEIEIKQTDGSDLPEWMILVNAVQIDLKQIGIVSSSATAVHVVGNYAYLADSSKGLKIIDITNPSEPNLIGTLDIAGSAKGIYVAGNYAYMVIYTKGLMIIDIINPAVPSLIGSLSIYNLLGRGIFVIDDFAYLANYYEGLTIIDISTPNAPFVKGALYVSDLGAMDVFVVDDYAYLVNTMERIYHPASLKIIDISDPSAPSQIGTIDTVDKAVGIYVLGDYAYVAVSSSGLEIIDISNPFLPCQVGLFNTIKAVSVYVMKNYAYVADSSGGLKIIDVSDPKNPSLVDVVETNSSATDVYLKGNYAYLAATSAGLEIIQLFAETDDLFLTFTPEKSRFKFFNGIVGLNVLASDGIASTEYNFLLTITNQNPIIDRLIQSQRISQDVQFNMLISYDTFLDRDKDNLVLEIQLVNNIRLPGWLNRKIQPELLRTFEVPLKNIISVKNDYIYITKEPNGLSIVDISVIDKISTINTFATGGITEKMIMDGNKIYVANGDGGLIYFTFADETYLMLSGKCNIANSAMDLFVRGEKVFIIDNLGTLHIVKIPLFVYEPFTIGNYVAKDEIKGMDLRDEYAYIAASNAGLEIVHIGDYFNPQFLTNCSTRGVAEAVKLVNDLAFVADNHEGLSIIDVTELARPILIGNIQTRGNATKIDVQGEYAYLADKFVGLTIVDISRPTLPSIVGLYDTASEIFDFKISQDKIFLATANGIEILRLNIYLTGTPRNDDAGNYIIKVTAIDTLGKLISTSFSLTVEGSPQCKQIISNQKAKVTKYFSFFFDKKTFVDPNNDVLDYSSQMTFNTTSWPAWLQFNPLSGTYFGTPSVADVGTYNITLTADDKISGTASTTFLLTVEHVPTVKKEIRNQEVVVNRNFFLEVSRNTFEDLSGKPLFYSAKQLSGALLPPWLTFENTTMIFQGTPPANETGLTEIQLIASNGEDSVAATFNINVLINRSPSLMNQLSALRIGADIFFEYTIPDNTFSDPQGDSLEYRIILTNPEVCNQSWPFSFFEQQRLFGIRPELENGLPFWLHTNMTERQISGTAPNWAAWMSFLFWKRYKTYIMKVEATDGLTTASTFFDIILGGPALTEIILNTLFSIMGMSTMVLGIYGQRYILLNKNWFKNRYQRREKNVLITAAEDDEYILDLPPEKLGEIKVHVYRGIKKIELQGIRLPSWFRYRESSNSIVIKAEELCEREMGKYTISIFDKSNILQEQFDIRISDGTEEEIIASPALPQPPKSRREANCFCGLFGKANSLPRDEAEISLLPNTQRRNEEPKNLWNCFGIFRKKPSPPKPLQLQDLIQSPDETEYEGFEL